MVDITPFHDFHLVRPWWLIMLIPAWLLGWSLKYRQQWQSAWQRFISPLLLAPLLKGKINKPGNTLPFMMILFWTITILALGGPTWKKSPQSVKKIDNALVILLDLSPSMLAADIKPARLIVARHKIIDLLKARKEGYTALVAYSGDAHVVAPLTDDNETIINLVNVLEPAIMPIDGSNLEHALQKSMQLFKNSGYANGDILLITDGITEQAGENSRALLSNSGFILSIIGIGTKEGGPIPSSRGGFIKDDTGNIIMPSLDSTILQGLANDVNGSYTLVQLSDRDILPLVDGRHRLDQEKTTSVDREFDQWKDMGALLTWPLLILILLAFRRGVILSLILLIPLLHATQAEANEGFWGKLWLNDNQRAMKAMEHQDYEKASRLFNDPEWKAAAQYQQKDYGSSAENFSKKLSSINLYNKGNALAKNGNFQEAIKSYEKSIKLNPDFEDAKYNKKIVEDILKNKTTSKQTGDSEDKQQSQPDDQKMEQPESSNQESGTSNNPLDPGSQQSASEQDNGQEYQSRESPLEQAPQNKISQKKPSEEEEMSAVAKQPQSTQEEKQAMEQWLRKVPDDPSSLLKNKFEYYYQLELQRKRRGLSSSHLNNEERW